MKFTVYCLQSTKAEWLYIGMTDNFDRRFSQHQKGQSKSTAPWRPFCLVFKELHEDSISARNREKYLKTASGKRYIRKKYFVEINKCK